MKDKIDDELHSNAASMVLYKRWFINSSFKRLEITLSIMTLIFAEYQLLFQFKTYQVLGNGFMMKEFFYNVTR